MVSFLQKVDCSINLFFNKMAIDFFLLLVTKRISCLGFLNNLKQIYRNIFLEKSVCPCATSRPLPKKEQNTKMLLKKMIDCMLQGWKKCIQNHPSFRSAQDRKCAIWLLSSSTIYHMDQQVCLVQNYRCKPTTCPLGGLTPQKVSPHSLPPW